MTAAPPAFDLPLGGDASPPEDARDRARAARSYGGVLETGVTNSVEYRGAPPPNWRGWRTSPPPNYRYQIIWSQTPL